jgi:hypothetical protein
VRREESRPGDGSRLTPYGVNSAAFFNNSEEVKKGVCVLAASGGQATWVRIVSLHVALESSGGMWQPPVAWLPGRSAWCSAL